MSEKISPWNGVELKSRRESLGLNQQQLAALLGVSQAVLSHWETGVRSPRDVNDVRDALELLEEIEDDIFNTICDMVEGIVESMADREYEIPEVEVRTYLRDEDFWAADTRGRKLGLPSVLHRVAAAKAQKCLREEEIALVYLIS